MVIEWGVVVPAGALAGWSLLECLRLRWRSARGCDRLFGDWQGASILLELIGLVSLLTGVTGVRNRLGFWGSLVVLREKSLSAGELVHDVFNGFPLGIVPGLVGPGGRADLWDRFFLYL